MARTLIGQLILRLRAEGLGEAQKVKAAMSDIERAARTLGATGVNSWGIGFQRQLDKLKLTRDEIGRIQQSWIALHNDIKRRNIGAAMRSAEVSHWKTETLSTIAAARADFDKHARDLEGRARAHASRMSTILKPGFVMLGAYTAPYFAGILGLEALTASSERRREIYRQQSASIPGADRDTLFAKSEELGQKYPSLPITSIMEMSRHAYSVMGDGERAAAVLERMAQAFVALQSARGVDTAVTQLNGLIRGMDNLGLNADGQRGIDQVNELIDAAVKAAQVDPDFDPGQFFSFARRTKVAGPALSPEFLARSSVYMQDMGADTAGNMLAMAFKAFVLEAVGSAGGKKYLAERDRIGIRKNGKLVESELFGSDPDTWVLKHLIPALERDGVDLNNETAVATAVGKLSGNTNATGLMTRVITQRQQIERWLRIMDEALGTCDAENVRANDPFVAWESFKSSLENLSAALMPIDTIAAGLNKLADGVNALAAIGEDHPALAALGIFGAGYGAYKGGKFAFDKMSDMFGLKGSAVALNGSAAALTRAAAALGGASVLDGKPDGKPKGSGVWGLAAAAFGSLSAWLAAAAVTQGSTPDNPYVNASEEDRQRVRDEANLDAITASRGYGRTGPRNPRRPGPLEDPAIPSPWDDFWAEQKAKAADAGADMESSLNINAKPNVDSSSISAAVGEAKQLLNLLGMIDAAAANAVNRVRQARQSAGAEMRRNFSDGFGAMP